MLADNIWITFITPEGEVSKWKSNRMLWWLIVHNHMWFYVSTTANCFAFKTDPVFFCVSTVFTWCCYCQILKVWNWSNIFHWNTMWTLFNWLTWETHKVWLLIIKLWFSFFIFNNLLFCLILLFLLLIIDIKFSKLSI